MSATAYLLGALVQRLGTVDVAELRAAAREAGLLGGGRNAERRFAAALVELAFAGHLRASAPGRVTLDPDPWRDER